MSHTFASLSTLSMAELEAVLAQGTAPSFPTLCGAEFRGWNVFGNATAAAVGKIMGIQRFAKGFFVREGAPDTAPFVEGYNVKIRRGGADEPWLDLVDNTVTRHAFFRVHRAGEGDHGGRHPHALLLDYSQGDPMPGLLDGKNLKDYVVHPDPNNRDLLLGKAYFLLGPIVNVNFFVCERLRSATFTPPPRTRA
jgi:hypothetical protein